MMCQESGHDFLTSLMAFVNLVLSGCCPLEVASVFFGGHLLAMNKKSGGIRRIAIGFSLRCLASKCTSSFGINRLRQYFYQISLEPVFQEVARQPSIQHVDTSRHWRQIMRRENLILPMHSWYAAFCVQSNPGDLCLLSQSAYGQPFFCFMANTPSPQKRVHNTGSSRSSPVL